LKKKSTALIMALLCLLLALAACSGSPSEDAGQDPAPGTEQQGPDQNKDPAGTPPNGDGGDDVDDVDDEDPAEEVPDSIYDIAENRQDAIYNPETARAVSLGMTKAALEAAHTPGAVTKNGYTSYDEYAFYIRYYGNDTVKEIVVSTDSDWRTFNGVTRGTPAEELTAAYGKPLSDQGGIYVYYTYQNVLLTALPSMVEIDLNQLYTIDFVMKDGAVDTVMLSRF
jgi:hypothetical protein